MYQVGLILKSAELLAQLTALHVWGIDTGFQISAVLGSIKALEEVLEERQFDLLIVESALAEVDEYTFLRRIGQTHVALCSTRGDFASARQGILHGVKDYFTLPLSEAEVTALFDRIRAEGVRQENSAVENADELLNLFLRQETELYHAAEQLFRRNLLSPVADSTVKEVFQRYEWLDLYLNEEEYLSEQAADTAAHRDKFFELFQSWLRLNPRHNDTLDALIQYILLNPESDLRQKSLSEEVHINKSYLSTVFTAQTDMRFVDYITYIKLMRAAWLLKNTDLKVSEIAGRMDYKDIAYFSKQFKKEFHLTPSEYRIPCDYQFQI